MIQLIEDSGVSIAYRDELYRTARDVSMQATQPENTREIDKYVLSLAARGNPIHRIYPIKRCIPLISIKSKLILIFFCARIGELAAIKHLVIEGYDHIVDVHDDDTIVNVAHSRGHDELGKYLESIPNFEMNREKLHRAIRTNDFTTVKELIESPDGNDLAKAKNYYGTWSIDENCQELVKKRN